MFSIPNVFGVTPQERNAKRDGYVHDYLKRAAEHLRDATAQADALAESVDDAAQWGESPINDGLTEGRADWVGREMNAMHRNLSLFTEDSTTALILASGYEVE